MMNSKVSSLERLTQGNQRFVDGSQLLCRDNGQEGRMEMAAGQNPFAIILGCSDSRVPAEIIFDQGPGDLFVIRVAGNIVTPSQIGSVEFAVMQFGTPLVVVLGHSNCGAVQATLDEVRRPSGLQSPNLAVIIDRVRNALDQLMEQQMEPEALMQKAVKANVLASVKQLQHGSEIIEQLISDGLLHVIGAEYSIETGKVEFYG